MTEHSPTVDPRDIVQAIRGVNPEAREVARQTLLAVLAVIRYPNATFPESLRAQVERLRTQEPVIDQVIEPIQQLAADPANYPVISQMYDDIQIPPVIDE